MSNEKVRVGDRIRITHTPSEDAVEFTIKYLDELHGEQYAAGGHIELHTLGDTDTEYEILERAVPPIGTPIKGKDEDGDEFVGVVLGLREVKVAYTREYSGTAGTLPWNEISEWEEIK